MLFLQLLLLLLPKGDSSRYSQTQTTTMMNKKTIFFWCIHSSNKKTMVFFILYGLGYSLWMRLHIYKIRERKGKKYDIALIEFSVELCWSWVVTVEKTRKSVKKGREMMSDFVSR